MLVLKGEKKGVEMDQLCGRVAVGLVVLAVTTGVSHAQQTGGDVAAGERRFFQAERAIRGSLHDSASYQLSRGVVMVGGAVCMEYSAKNGFGARRKAQAVMPPKDDIYTSDRNPKDFRRVWMKHCAQGKVLSVIK